MAVIVDYPTVLFISLLVLLVAAMAIGAFILRHRAPLPEEERDDFSVVQTSTLTLLALLIGFSLSMAVNRYDQRKSLEESEACYRHSICASRSDGRSHQCADEGSFGPLYAIETGRLLHAQSR
jgi:hypothetical protein